VRVQDCPSLVIVWVDGVSSRFGRSRPSPSGHACERLEGSRHRVTTGSRATKGTQRDCCASRGQIKMSPAHAAVPFAVAGERGCVGGGSPRPAAHESNGGGPIPYHRSWRWGSPHPRCSGEPFRAPVSPFARCGRARVAESLPLCCQSHREGESVRRRTLHVSCTSNKPAAPTSVYPLVRAAFAWWAVLGSNKRSVKGSGSGAIRPLVRSAGSYVSGDEVGCRRATNSGVGLDSGCCYCSPR
jgi:hypothetical protein